MRHVVLWLILGAELSFVQRAICSTSDAQSPPKVLVTSSAIPSMDTIIALYESEHEAESEAAGREVETKAGAAQNLASLASSA